MARPVGSVRSRRSTHPLRTFTSLTTLYNLTSLTHRAGTTPSASQVLLFSSLWRILPAQIRQLLTVDPSKMERSRKRHPKGVQNWMQSLHRALPSGMSYKAWPAALLLSLLLLHTSLPCFVLLAIHLDGSNSDVALRNLHSLLLGVSLLHCL